MRLPDEYTDAQRAAVQAAYSALGEQFDGAVIIVETELAPTKETGGEPGGLLYWCHVGGHSRTVGMTQRVLSRLLT